MEKLKLTKDLSVTPDRLYIPEWNIDKSHNNKDAYTGSSSLTETYVGSGTCRHPMMPRDLDLLDFRIWKDTKLIALWTNTTDALSKLKVGIENIFNGNFTVFGKREWFQEIYDFDIIFVEWDLYENYVVKCKYSELEELIDSKELLVDNNKYRVFHLASPIQKQVVIKNDKQLQTEKTLYYKESCKMWSKRIGEIDVCNYHLLIYEE